VEGGDVSEGDRRTPEVESTEYVVSRDGHDVDWYQDRAEALARATAEQAGSDKKWRVTKRVTYLCDLKVIFGDPEEDDEE
jgi:hypothetical protein